MIDLSDPNTDVIKLYKDFLKWIIKNGEMYRQAGICKWFRDTAVEKWLYNNEFIPYKEEEKCRKLAKILLSVWSRINLIIVENPNNKIVWYEIKQGDSHER